MTTETKRDLLDQLKTAYYSGILHVRTADGRDITYRSSQEMLAAISSLEADLGNKPRWQWFRLVPNRRGR